jgi:hypothetical protein
MADVYLETSFVSSCVTDRSDAASVYRRQVSQEWWAAQRHRHSVFVSAEVTRELSHPQFPHRAESLTLIADVPLLPITAEVQGLARILVQEKVMPGPVAGDAVHVAVAAVHGMEYLLSWNVRHLANPNKLVHLRAICLRMGVATPLIVTPDLLWEADDE